MNNLTNSQMTEKNPNYFLDASNRAIKDFFQQRLVHQDKYMVLIMNIIKIGESKGEFVISYIQNDRSYQDINVSHFIFVEKKLVLIKVASTKLKELEMFGIKPINDLISTTAYDLLAGPNMSISSQPAPMLVCKYKYGNINCSFYNGMHPPKKKYWF